MKPRAMLFGPILLWGVAHAQQGPSGEVRGTAWQHTQQSLEAALANAWVALPAKATGGGAVYGKLAHVPKELPPGAVAAPVLVFTHGSGGISDAIKQRQKCLADDLEIASITADSMQLPDPIVYTSPVSKDAYEKVHALRAQEINATVSRLSKWPWADASRLIIAGTSEGAVSIARYRSADGSPKERARVIYSCSCEPNYHVDEARTTIPDTMPVLNIMSLTDVYFSQANPWLGNPTAKGHCGDALKNNKAAEIVLLPGAPHTLFNLPAARGVTKVFLQQVLT